MPLQFAPVLTILTARRDLRVIHLAGLPCGCSKIEAHHELRNGASMVSYPLELPAEEVVRLLRAEIASEHGQPELNIIAAKDYVIEEDFDSTEYGIHDGEEYDLVTSIATLTIEPRVESGYWVLETVVERVLGPLRISKEDEFALKELNLDEFETELSSPGRKRITVRLEAQTPAVRQHFDRWLAKMRELHPNTSIP
jgi:hypothetical protein